MGFTFSRFYVNTVFGRFRSVHKISTLDRKYPQWARLELELADPSDFYSDSVSTPPWLHFRISSFIGVGHSILNCCVNFFLFLEKLNIFLYLGLSEGLTLCWIKLSEKCRSQQHSNLRRKPLSDFKSGALTTRPLLNYGVTTFICRWLLNCCVGFILSRFHVNNIFGSFRSVHKKISLDRKYPQWARLELELDGPIEFLFRLRQHSALTAFQNLWFYRCRSSDPELLCDFLPLSREIEYFFYFGLSEGWTLCWIKVSEKCRIQQDSNLRWKTPSDF